MDIPRGSSIALPPPTSQSHWRRLSRSNSQTSSESGRTGSGMVIPGARMEDVPPALPPPRYIQDLDDGVDISWKYQNDVHTHSRLAPIKAGSSLHGRAPLPTDEDIDMDTDYESSSQPQLPLHIATGSPFPSLRGRPPSSSDINQR